MADIDRVVQQMRQELDELRAEVRELRAAAAPPPPTAPGTPVASRRQLLSRGAIAAGAGALGAVFVGRPAAAADDAPVLLGRVDNDAVGSTQVTASGPTADALYGATAVVRAA